ncbi:MAG: ABC transporter permease [Synergistaceae bacterium]|jgi:NitT/TauT family transport system permease protein|nr:ABC transporter permease [Synergistaceae bacterium]
MAESSRIRLLGEGWFGGLAVQVALLGAVLALWYVLVVGFDVPEWQLPTPARIFGSMVNDFTTIAPHLLSTSRNVLLGFFISVALGLSLAIVIYFNAPVGMTITPFINLMCIIPLITIVPLLMLWLGFGNEAKLIAVVLQSFPIVNLNAFASFSNVDPLRLELMQSLKATRYQTMRCCVLPDAMPGIFTGVKLAAILALIAEVTSEIVGGNTGLGAQIIQYTQYMKMPQAFACVFYTALFGALFHQSLSFIERQLVKK